MVRSAEVTGPMDEGTQGRSVAVREVRSGPLGPKIERCRWDAAARLRLGEVRNSERSSGCHSGRDTVLPGGAVAGQKPACLDILDPAE
jgi:hypothetical protein